ncbi:hypothetical protein [Mesorhizobium sp. L-8-10]|uniref:hypothetical protein n=1 Tax=Mesorhizobium sp. L-8-10 TaxID=2744523 RepID=UPI001AEFE3DD
MQRRLHAFRAFGDRLVREADDMDAHLSPDDHHLHGHCFTRETMLSRSVSGRKPNDQPDMGLLLETSIDCRIKQEH